MLKELRAETVAIAEAEDVRLAALERELDDDPEALPESRADAVIVSDWLPELVPDIVKEFCELKD